MNQLEATRGRSDATAADRDGVIELTFEHLLAVLESSRDALSVVDRETMRFVHVNAALCTLRGYTREEFMLTRPHQGVAGFSQGHLERLYDDVIDISPAPHVTIEERIRSDGAKLLTEVTRNAVRVAGRWTMIVTSRDITDHAAARTGLARVRRAMDHMLDAVALVDRETMTFIDANLEAARRAGTTLAAYLRSTPWSRAKGRTREELETLYDEVISIAPTAHVREVDLLRPDGTTYPSESVLNAVKLDGRWIIIVCSRDITERKQAQRELQRRADELARSNEDLARFAYVASHDLMEPLRMITSYTQLLQRRYLDKFDADGREFMDFIIDGTRRMKRLMEDLLAYSTAGRITKAFEPLDLNSILDDVELNLRQLVADKSARIERSSLPTVIGDRTSLTQLLQNLIANALKFAGPSPPVVRVSATEGPEGWHMSVSDNGIGIAAKDFERIFVVFQRMHGKARVEGSGLGLAICKKIVERHGGRIWVESVPGEGSVFSFSLPTEEVAPIAGA